MSTLLARSTVLADDALHAIPRTDATTVAPWAPRQYRGRWGMAVVAGDLLALVVAFGFGFGFAWVWADAHPSLGGCGVVALILCAWFACNGRYIRTLGIAAHDEFYYAIAYVAIAAAVLLPILALLGITSRSFLAIAIGFGLCAVLIGMVRYALRTFVPESELFVAPTTVIEEASRAAETIHAERPTHIAVAEHIGQLRLSARTLGEQTLLAVNLPSVMSSSARFTKRAFDILVASIALCVSAPIVILGAIAIVIESGFPILYSQERLGEHGRVFRIFKLRSMQQDAERASGPIWATREDVRVTRVGRILRSTSVDELPQLFNVLRGEMSIVGPRPERPAFVERFASSYPRYVERLLVAPGLTACSHLYMPRAVTAQAISERLEYDLYYIRNWSLAVDIAIVMKTAAEVMFHRAP